MDNSGQITEEVKTGVYKKIVDLMSTALENGSLSAEESEEASLFILNRLDNATTKEYLDALLEEFANRWPIFSPLLQPQRNEEALKTDEKNIENITNEIKNLT